MRVISKRKIRDYSRHNAQAELPLVEWYIKMQHIHVNNITELKKVFNSVDYVQGYTIFNIGGNHYRLIAAIHYEVQRCYIREIWTHAEYSKAYSQAKLKRGLL
ncbi:MAG: type II toxin-antitoxin system HigB family toxin [Gammaproteobacteria bacterium]|nr:type II toxin-antitoxin system HigB family toxin [Gammaproteobacteria bacterium]